MDLQKPNRTIPFPLGRQRHCWLHSDAGSCCASWPCRGGVCPSHRVRLVRRLLSNLTLARVQKAETQAGVPVGLIWGEIEHKPQKRQLANNCPASAAACSVAVPWLAVLVLASAHRILPLVVGSTGAITARSELRAEQRSPNRFGRRIGRRELDRAGLKR